MREKSISTTQLAEICGVSQGTVDRALHGRPGINPDTRARILRTAEEYGYRPNIHARSIAGGSSMLIGVVVFDLNNQYFSDLLMTIEAACAERGYSMIAMFTGKDPQKEIECVRNLYHMAVDGIVLCPVQKREAYENYLLSLRVPLVTVGNRLECFPYVGIDNALAMQEAVEYVLQKGYDRLIYVKPRLGAKNAFAQTERLEAFRAVCEREQTAYQVTELASAEAALLPNRKNAFVCPTDLYAVQLLHTAAQHHAGVIGFDNIRLLDELQLRLDSVAYDSKQAAEMLVRYIVDKQPISGFVGHSLVVRGSI